MTEQDNVNKAVQYFSSSYEIVYIDTKQHVREILKDIWFKISKRIDGVRIRWISGWTKAQTERGITLLIVYLLEENSVGESTKVEAWWGAKAGKRRSGGDLRWEQVQRGSAQGGVIVWHKKNNS